MPFCAFPSVRRPPHRRPSLVINLTELVEIEKNTDRMISNLHQKNYATTPLHTTDIIASEYMYPSSTTPIESEHLSVHSSRDSLESIDDFRSLGFQSQDDLDTPLSSLASSPLTRPSLLSSIGKPDLPSLIASTSETKELHRWKSSVSRRHEAQLQDSILERGNGSISSHKSAKPESSAKLSKSLPPLPPELNSRNLLNGDNSRKSVAQKIAALGNKISKDTPRSTGIECPYEARDAPGADEGGKGSVTVPPSLKVQNSRKALPVAQLSPVLSSRPDLPSLKVYTSQTALPITPLNPIRAPKPELPPKNESELSSRTSSSPSIVSFTVQAVQPSDPVTKDSFMVPVANVKEPIRTQTLSKSSTGLHVLTALTSKPIHCENPFVSKSSDPGSRVANLNLREKAIPPVLLSSEPTIDDNANDMDTSLSSVFSMQSNSKRPTPAPPLSSIHFSCYQSHRNMNNSRNDIAQVPCMACHVDDKELRWKCSWCCLRICNRCMEVLDEAKDRDLSTLLQTRQKRGLANRPWHSTVLEGFTDGPSF